MKTLVHTSLVARSIVSLVALTAMLQLTGCQPTDVKPSPTQSAQVHIANPMPEPTVICPDCVNGDLPHIEPQPRVIK